MRYWYITFLCSLSTLGCQPTEPEDDLIFDALALVDASPEKTASILGAPDTTYYLTIFNKRYLVQYYNQYGVEVRHLNGSVNGIIVNEPHPLKFAPETITKFGIDYVEPTQYDSLAMIMWKNIEGFKVVNFYLRGVARPDSIAHSYHIYFNMDTARR